MECYLSITSVTMYLLIFLPKGHFPLLDVTGNVLGIIEGSACGRQEMASLDCIAGSTYG